MNSDDEADRLIKGDFSGVVASFHDANFATPKFVWDPQTEDLSAHVLRLLRRYWLDLPKASSGPFAGLPLASAVDALDMPRVLGFLMLLDVVDDGADFVYRVYGSKISEVVGFDSTGKRVSETKPHPVTRQMFLAVYRAVYKSGRPIYTEHDPTMNIAVVTWNRLVLPLVDDQGRIIRILAGNVPVFSGRI